MILQSAARTKMRVLHRWSFRVMVRKTRTPIFLAFSLALAAVCFLRPIAEDFDRYIYESLVRARSQPISQIYEIVKHESPRAEASSILDSPGHLGELFPLYAIRPVYVEVIAKIHDVGMPIQRSITLVSAASLFLIAWILAWATRNYLYSALVMSMPGVLEVGRTGGPDALSSLVVISGCFLALREKLFPAILLLLISVWIRTDNVLVVVAVLAWLLWEGKLRAGYVFVLASLAAASVELINFFSGNYGLKALFYFSFIHGRSPAEITPHVTVVDYARVFLQSAQSVGPQLAPWLLLGFAAWRLNSPIRKFLIPLSAACVAHYALFPSPEARYFVWAYLITGAVFIRALSRPSSRQPVLVSSSMESAIQNSHSTLYEPRPEGSIA